MVMERSGLLFLLLLFIYFLHIQIGHVTKSGDIAGPRVLEHIVDVVLYMEVGTSLDCFYWIVELFFLMW